MVCPSNSKSRGATLTAADIVAGVDLTGKTAVVTGGNTGIGFETARALASAGARVIITSRSRKDADAAASEILSSGVQGKVVGLQLNLNDLASVDRLVQDLQTEARIDYLILNAGILSPLKKNDEKGWEIHFSTNHCGHFALTMGLLDKLKAQAFPSRIVVVSSILHKNGSLNFKDLHFNKGRIWSGPKGYNQSKLANILFAKELARRLEGTQISVFSLHPGIINTTIFRKIVKPIRVLVVLPALSLIYSLKTVEQGAATTVFAALSTTLEGWSGAYLSDCAIEKPAKAARDPETALKLWTVTEALLASARTGPEP